MAINQVHDKFFKSALSNKKVSEEFFASLLPADVLEQVELDNLECAADAQSSNKGGVMK